MAAAGVPIPLAAVYEMTFLATFERPIETKGWLLERLQPFFPAHRQRHTKQTFNCHELRRNVHAWRRAARVNRLPVGLCAQTRRAIGTHCAETR